MKTNRNTKKPRRAISAGFTLFEMVIVLAIIALLIGVGVGGLIGVLGDGQETATRAQMKVLDTHLVRYNTKAGGFPTTDQGLIALVKRPTTGPEPRSWDSLASEKDLLDAYNQPLQYARPANVGSGPYDLWSIGEDGENGTEDDIYSNK